LIGDWSSCASISGVLIPLEVEYIAFRTRLQFLLEYSCSGRDPKNKNARAIGNKKSQKIACKSWEISRESSLKQCEML